MLPSRCTAGSPAPSAPPPPRAPSSRSPAAPSAPAPAPSPGCAAARLVAARPGGGRAGPTRAPGALGGRRARSSPLAAPATALLLTAESRQLPMQQFASDRCMRACCSIMHEESVRLRVGAFAGTLFAAVDGRLRGLTRRYACSLSATCLIPERKLLTVSESPTRRWRRSGRAAPRRSAILRSPTSRWPQQCSVQKAAEPKETAESGSAHAPSDHGASSG